MDRVGTACASAAIESLFALLQNNTLERKVWATREELRMAIATWIEDIYHRRRRTGRLSRLPPFSSSPR